MLQPLRLLTTEQTGMQSYLIPTLTDQPRQTLTYMPCSDHNQQQMLLDIVHLPVVDAKENYSYGCIGTEGKIKDTKQHERCLRQIDKDNSTILSTLLTRPDLILAFYTPCEK